MSSRSRSDVARNELRILQAGSRALAADPAATVADIAKAAGLSRATVHRHFPRRADLVKACEDFQPRPQVTPPPADLLPPGTLGRNRPVSVEAIHVFDVVSPGMLPEQLVAEASRIAGVPLALYVLDIDGTHLLRVAGPERLPKRIPAPLAIGPEIDSDGLSELREELAEFPAAEVVPLWVRGRANGVLITLGTPRQSLTEMARQASVAVTLADRYTDAFARATRRESPTAAAEIQQSLLPPRIARLSGAEIAGNVLPSYRVAGDWFDYVDNIEGVWVSIADGLKESTPAAASSAVALGALRASRRSGGSLGDALILMHRTLREMPGPKAEMSAVLCRWDPATHELSLVNCGHVPPIILRADGEVVELPTSERRGLGGRAAPTANRMSERLGFGDRLLLVSDGVTERGKGLAGLGTEGVVEAARTSETATAADTVRRVHSAVLDSCTGELEDDATVVCLAVG